jgi:HlyD family secretion protein
MKSMPFPRRTLALFAVIIPMLALFIYVGLLSGPLAPVAVTFITVASRAITPALYGIGTVEARYTYKIGPTFAGRVKRLDLNVGDHVRAGQLIGEMDPVDLDERIRSLESAFRRAQASLREAEARQAYALKQAGRYDELLVLRAVSEEAASTKQQELQVADASLTAAREDMARARSDREALVAQRNNLRLVSPEDGVVVMRDAEPGTTVVAGQAVVEIIDPATLWVNARFDQTSSAGLIGKLPARIVLRSREGEMLKGRVLRIEPKADAVTEEMLAKVVFDTLPRLLPPLGELAEVTIDLPVLAPVPVVPNAAIRRMGDQAGVWRITGKTLSFVPIKRGASDLNGNVQVREGLNNGDQVVLYSEKTLTPRSRIRIVEHIPGVPK